MQGLGVDTVAIMGNAPLPANLTGKYTRRPVLNSISDHYIIVNDIKLEPVASLIAMVSRPREISSAGLFMLACVYPCFLIIVSPMICCWSYPDPR